MDRRAFVSGLAAIPTIGLMGPANAQSLRQRRSVHSLAANDPFFAKYGDAVKRMHDLQTTAPNDRRSWRNQALIHLQFCVHGRNDFFHWHRHYITQFELICGSLIGDPSFALPYWDWTTSQGRIPEPFYTNPLLNVVNLNDPSNAQNDNWGGSTVTTGPSRALAQGVGLQQHPDFGFIFTPNAVDNVLAQSAFPLFWQQIESNQHGAGHVGVGGGAPPGGHMSSGMSPLDPIFWLHHCNADRLWEKWRNAGNATPSINRSYANHFVDAAGSNVTRTAAQALDASALGFSYVEPAPAGPIVASTAQPAVEAAATNSVLRASAVGAVDRIAQRQTVTRAPVSVPTATKLSVRNLQSSVLSSRVFRSSTAAKTGRLSAEASRLLLRLNGVSLDKDNDRVVVKVFVNCTYLSVGTPTSDPHYVGTFALFGGDHGVHAGHAGASGKASATIPKGATIVVDASDALRTLFKNGLINTDVLDVQLVPVAVNGSTSTATVTVTSIEALKT